MDNGEISNFFNATAINVFGNAALREPQREGYFAIKKHFASESEPCWVQLPVGCGKTGLIGLTPFGIADGRVLVIAPNLIIKANIIRELDVSNPACFYAKRGVFAPEHGPFLTELKTSANIHDCDAAHIVVGNIQQFAGDDNRWFVRSALTGSGQSGPPRLGWLQQIKPAARSQRDGISTKGTAQRYQQG